MTETLHRPTVGAPAPNITLVDTEARPWRLREQHGRTTVVIFHRHIH